MQTRPRLGIALIVVALACGALGAIFGKQALANGAELDRVSSAIVADQQHAGSGPSADRDYALGNLDVELGEIAELRSNRTTGLVLTAACGVAMLVLGGLGIAMRKQRAAQTPA